MPKVRIAIAEGALADLAWATSVAEKFDFEVVFGPVDTLAELQTTAKDCAVVVVALHKMTEEKISQMPESVKCISRLGVGLDSIDLVAAAKYKLPVIFQPTYAYNEVANHAAAMALALHRGIYQATTTTQDGKWIPATQIAEITSLQDSTLGVIGCGRIGQTFIKKMQPFVKDVIGFDPAVTQAIPGVTMTKNLDELLTKCKVISMHAPYMPSTHHMIGKRELALMQKGSILVNVSRGGLIDEAALMEALESGHLDGAGLDVFEKEPLAEDAPIRKTKNLLLSPHIAWYSKSSGPRLVEWGLMDAVNFITKQTISNGKFAAGPF
ncbi:D-isomer specific 2-hydroxyacid dehydrogenase family protein [Actinomycetes bacterium]|nr:D-isomer specific 2-hydroxyacid dehydrogenase family protein [Actinomycetes bacterium]